MGNRGARRKATATQVAVKELEARAAPAPVGDGTPTRKKPDTSGLRPWKKGQSGNPAGRPKDAYRIAELARGYGPEAIARLVELMQQRDEPKVALDAATRLLDRGFGKALTVKELNVNLGDKAQDFITALREIAARPRITIAEDGKVIDAPYTDDPEDAAPS